MKDLGEKRLPEVSANDPPMGQTQAESDHCDKQAEEVERKTL